MAESQWDISKVLEGLALLFALGLATYIWWEVGRPLRWRLKELASS